MTCVQDAIRKPIIRTESKLVKKEASEIFRYIQMYMGDRPLVMGKSALTPFSIAVDIVCRGWSNIALRDEIFIQLCRQTTRNPLLSVISVYLLVLSLTATYALVVYLSVNLEVTEVAMVVVEVAAAVVTFFVFIFLFCAYI